MISEIKNENLEESLKHYYKSVRERIVNENIFANAFKGDKRCESQRNINNILSSEGRYASEDMIFNDLVNDEKGELVFKGFKHYFSSLYNARKLIKLIVRYKDVYIKNRKNHSLMKKIFILGEYGLDKLIMFLESSNNLTQCNNNGINSIEDFVSYDFYIKELGEELVNTFLNDEVNTFKENVKEYAVKNDF